MPPISSTSAGFLDSAVASEVAADCDFPGARFQTHEESAQQRLPRLPPIQPPIDVEFDPTGKSE